jgi:hypothetical protein
VKRDVDAAASAERSRSRFSAATIKEWFWTALALNFLLVLAQDISGVDGTAWTAVRVIVLAVLATLLFGWVYSWAGEAKASERGWPRMAAGWTSSVLMAGAVVGVAVLVGLVIDDIVS